jgi:glucosamine--fructose-6-phosphate aminotransferase (isomerizing)
MCGIVGYTGKQEATPIIIEGLRKLEYRGYDSAGVCVISSGQAAIRRSEGKLVNLDKLLAKDPTCGDIGIGHTRWATHGRPSERNAHPHQAGSIIVVHNGIIENYLELKEKLKGLGRIFKSDTDTEVISHIIDEKLKETGQFEQAVRLALQELRGAYAVCILCENEPGTLIAAKQGSPMVVGLGDKEYLVASDIPAILAHTRNMVFMEDGEMVVFRDDKATFSTVSGKLLKKKPRHIDWSPLMAEKGGYKHFMLKEIFEQSVQSATPLPAGLRRKKGRFTWKNCSLPIWSWRASTVSS